MSDLSHPSNYHRSSDYPLLRELTSEFFPAGYIPSEAETREAFSALARGLDAYEIGRKGEACEPPPPHRWHSPRRNHHPAPINGLRVQAKPTNGSGAVRSVAIPGREPERDISTSTSLTEVPMPSLQSETRSPNWTKLELESVKSLRQVEEMTSLDRDTLTRVYGEYIVKLSPKRYGMKFRNVLRILSGDAASTADRVAARNNLETPL
jgi:hypothetical protein